MPLPPSFHETLLTPKASRTVEARWSFVATTQGQSLILPDGRCDIIVRDNMHRPDPPITVITGPATAPYCIPIKPGDRWQGLRLRPDQGGLIWKDQLSSAANTVLRGHAALCQVPYLSNQTEVLQPPPASPPQTDTRISALIELTHTTGGRIKISDMADMLGLSPRHLNRTFTATVGISVKIYAQLVQFHRALRLLTGNALSIADVVFEAGYADHAHMTRSFRRFGGFVPSAIPTDLFVPELFPA